MATVYARKNKNGSTTWRVMFRRKGLPTLCRGFSSEEEAHTFAKTCEEDYCLNPNSYILSKQQRILDKRKREFAFKKEAHAHCLMRIHPAVTQDPVLIHAMKHAFQWANEMGLSGMKTYALHLHDPTPDDDTPKQSLQLWCKIQKEKE